MGVSESKVLGRGPDGTVKVAPWVSERYPNAFFFEVDGGGMSRTVSDGSMVLIDPDTVPQNGSIVAVELEDGEPYLRRLFRGQGTLMLVADGYEAREDMVLEGPEADSVLILGTAVWYQSNGEL